LKVRGSRTVGVTSGGGGRTVVGLTIFLKTAVNQNSEPFPTCMRSM
jgi:hypothetical protein